MSDIVQQFVEGLPIKRKDCNDKTGIEYLYLDVEGNIRNQSSEILFKISDYEVTDFNDPTKETIGAYNTISLS